MLAVLVVSGGAEYIFLLLFPWSGGVGLEHGVVLLTEFQVEGEFAPEEGPVAEGTVFVVHVLGEELVLLRFGGGHSLYLLHLNVI